MSQPGARNLARILAVDDDPAVLRYVRDALSRVAKRSCPLSARTTDHGCTYWIRCRTLGWEDNRQIGEESIRPE